MIVELIDKLIERCIQLIKHQEEVRRDTFNNYVDPILHELESVHKTYLESFRKYRTIIMNSKDPLDLNRPIFDLIREDSLFTQGQRRKLKALSDSFKDPVVGKFLSQVSLYLCLASDGTDILINDDYLTSNFPRAKLFTGLSRTFNIGLNEIFSIDPIALPAGYEPFFTGSEPTEAEKRAEAIKTIDEITMKMQELYGFVLQEYSRLKHDLLT